MKTIAVTIGVGKGHKQMAEWAAEKVRRYLGLETRILGDEHMNYALPNVPHPKNIWTLKFSLFEIYPDADRIMYFDNDWRPVRAFNIDEYCTDTTKLYFVRDRVYSEGVRNLAKSYGINPDNYFNAGWFMAARKHEILFQKCKEKYHQFKESYGDQCIMNQVLVDSVTLLPSELNTLNFGYLPAHTVLGFHHGESRFIASGTREDYEWDKKPKEIVVYGQTETNVARVLNTYNINGFDKPGGTDKISDHSYGPIYETLLAPYIAGKNGKLVEVGVREGGSLLLWQNLCQNMRIVGIDSRLDIHELIKPQLSTDRTITLNLNAYTAEALIKLKQAEITEIDVAIDDGPHDITSQCIFLKLYLPLLKPGGFAVIEDVIDPDRFQTLKKEVPTGWNSQEINLRHIKNRSDDVVFIVQRPADS